VPNESLPYADRKRSMNHVIVAWFFGMVYTYGVTGAPLVGMFREAGATPFLIGLLTAVPSFAMLFQIIGSYVVTRTGSRKRVFLFLTLPSRLVWILVTAFAVMLPPGVSTVTLLLALVLVSRLADFAAGPAWLAWMGDLIPEDERGNFWATRQMWGNIGGTVGMLALNWYLGESPPAHRYFVFFLIVSFMGWLDSYIHRGVHGVKVNMDQEQPGVLEMFRQPLRDKRFAPFLFFLLLFHTAVSISGSMFYLMMLEEIHLTYFEISLYVAALFGGISIISSRFWGRLIDRHWDGARLVFVVTCAGIAMTAFAWPLVEYRQHWLIGLIIGSAGFIWSGWGVALMTLLNGLSPSKQRVSYMAMFGVTVGLGAMMGGMIGGWIAESLQGFSTTYGPLILTPFRSTFLVAGILQVLFFTALSRIRQPESLPIGVYVRRLFSLHPFARGTYTYLWRTVTNGSAETPPEEVREPVNEVTAGSTDTDELPAECDPTQRESAHAGER
jgi:MFS family permease